MHGNTTLLLRLALLIAVLCLPCGAPHHTAAAPAASACSWQDPSLQTQEQQAASAVWQRNLVRDAAIIHPSKAYAGIWLRDSFWSFLALDDPALARRAALHFATAQAANGQLPTQFASLLGQPLYKNDESTLLFLIWAGWQAQQQVPLTDTTSLRSALSYVQAHAHDGYYLSQEGSYASWFDGFKLPGVDTLSYNQGLYAVALLAARQLHLGVSENEVAAAFRGYQALTKGHGGYLRFSRNLAYHDISGLVGDFLAIWLYHKPILSDASVAATLRQQPPFGSGFKVVADAQGKPLSHTHFIAHFFPGDYQNGGSWLLYDYIALADGCLHHLPGLRARMAARLQLEFTRGPVFHEYLNTNPQSPLFGGEASYRDVFSWDTFVLRVDAILKGAST